MITINVLRGLQGQKDYELLQKVVQQFEDERAVKSYGDRHPELGKMFKCQVCQRRHRGTLPCLPTYAKNEAGEELLADQTTKKGVNGAANYKGRIARHRNARGLQDLERTRELFRSGDFEPYVFDDLDKRGKLALVEALRQLRKERRARRRKLRKISQQSRRINRAR